MNIHAFTGPGSDYPAFVSINKMDGKYTLTVRSRGNECGEGSWAKIDLTHEQIETMATELANYLAGDEEPGYGSRKDEEP